MHDGTVAIPLNMRIKSLLLGVAPIDTANFVSRKSPTVEAFKVLADPLRERWRNEVHEGIAQAASCFEIHRYVHKIKRTMETF